MKFLKKIIPVICLIPLLTGAAGYLISGETAADSLYASFALYFTNPVSDAGNGYIEFARWTAPLVTASAVLCVLKNIWDTIRWRVYLVGSGDNVAVYSDEALEISFGKGVRAIYPGTLFKGYARNHMILFSSDQKSLQFYGKYKKRLKKQTTYIGLRTLESGLIGEIKDVMMFDINGSISRVLWKQIALWKLGKENIHVVIYGDDSLAQEIMSIGLQLNLFSLRQHVNYHLISNRQMFQVKHKGMQLMNADEIFYYKADEERIWDVISNADVVIIADQIELELFQAIAVRASDHRIYYYSPNEGDAAAYLSLDALYPFGRNKAIFTDENIRRQKLIQKAIALNEQYAQENHTEQSWNALSGFLKASNISSADYGEVIAELSKQVSEEELAELEHIRWCRFHYLNYWKYWEPDNGRKKDEVRRLHKNLVAYDQLGEEEQAKDIATVRTFRRTARM